MGNEISFGTAPAAMMIFLTTIGISLYTMYRNHSLLRNMMLHPFSVVNSGKWYQIITSGFVHADLFHLMFNMLSFYFFAFQLERMLGSLPFILIYLSSMIFAEISTIIKNRNNQSYYALGASGAVSGVIFSSILFFPQSKIAFLLFPIGIPAPIFGLLYLAYCYYASKRSSDLINHEAHFWGALTGILISILLFPEVVGYFITSIF